jgi:hypothetical protein
MNFNFVTLLRRLAVILVAVIIIATWVFGSIFVGQNIGYGYGWMLYISPFLICLLYLLGMDSDV